jgi:hypothetical protein
VGKPYTPHVACTNSMLTWGHSKRTGPISKIVLCLLLFFVFSTLYFSSVLLILDGFVGFPGFYFCLDIIIVIIRKLFKFKICLNSRFSSYLKMFKSLKNSNQNLFILQNLFESKLFKSIFFKFTTFFEFLGNQVEIGKN